MPELSEFDRHIDRRSIPGEKWGRYAGRDILPMWVADMDFAAARPIIDAIRTRLDHGVLGYTEAWPQLCEAVTKGLERDFGWRVEADWLVWLPGTVSGLNVAARAIVEPGSAIFTATPVYPPFLSVHEVNHCQLATTPLVQRDGRWEWDRCATEANLPGNTRMFMLCNPHNPVGRVFDMDELTWIADLAEQRDLIICSDEIHCGLTLDDDRPHLPIATLSPSVAQRTITLMAPSKTWNIPALHCAFAIIPDADLRRRFKNAMRGLVPAPNVLGLVATEAAYRHGEAWRHELIAYLRGNRERVMTAVSKMPGLQMLRPEATYLAWIDCRGAKLEDPLRFFEAAGVGLSDGTPFGASGFLRLNFGCTKVMLDQALERMADALEKHLRSP